MRFELDLMRPIVAALDEHQRLKSDNECRRAIRQVTDSVMNDALLINSMSDLAVTAANTMMTLAEVLLHKNIDPQMPDFVNAAVALLGVSRNAMDKGLQVNDPMQMVTSAVMIEITCRGIFAALNLDYEAVLKAQVNCEALDEIIARRKPAATVTTAEGVCQITASMFGLMDREPPTPPELSGDSSTAGQQNGAP